MTQTTNPPTMTPDPTVPPEPTRRGVGVAILARRAELGRGKTRLAESMGAEATLEVYRRLIRICAAAVRGSGLEATVFFDPAPGDLAVWPTQAFRHGVQTDVDDLGARMGDAASAVLAGHRGVLIIGTDCPYLTADHLQTAADALRRHDVVLGPSHDGGYYLIGFSALHPELFRGISWSTAGVAEQTREVLAKAGLSHFELPTLSDVDVESDWLAYLATVHNS